MLRTKNDLTAKINKIQINNSQSEKLLGITINNDLKFQDHIKNICQKESTKTNALSRITPYMGLPERRQIMNAFFKSHFSYNLLTWMMNSKMFNVCV